MNEFTFVLKYNPEEHTDELGEALRNEFFNQDDGNYGCYSTFELRDGIEELPSEIVDNDWGDYEIKCSVFSKTINDKKVIMKYWWDGDGTLEFHFEDGSYLYNGDCKKDYVWEYVMKEGVT